MGTVSRGNTKKAAEIGCHVDVSINWERTSEQKMNAFNAIHSIQFLKLNCSIDRTDRQNLNRFSIFWFILLHCNWMHYLVSVASASDYVWQSHLSTYDIAVVVWMNHMKLVPQKKKYMPIECSRYHTHHRNTMIQYELNAQPISACISRTTLYAFQK